LISSTTDLHSSLIRRMPLFGAVAVVSSCGGSDLVLPGNGFAALRPLAGQDQIGTVESALPESLVVQVLDAEGVGVAGVRVTWSASGGGSVSPTTSMTDADGRAAAERVLGAVPGAYATAATAPVAEGSPTVFIANARPGAPHAERSAVATSTTSLTASTGSDAATVTVTVRDQHGNPVPGVNVALSATGSGNKITQPSASTNASGVATGKFSATAAGAHAVAAKAGGLKIGETVTVTVHAAAANAGRSEVTVPDGTAGAPTVVAIRLRDQFGNAIAGARSKLGFSVSGANTGAELSVSEAEGGAYTARYTPTTAGADLLHVALDGTAVLGGPFRSAVVPGPASSLTTTAVVDRTATIFDPFVEISIEARDAFGNPVRRPGEDVTITAAFGGDRRSVPVSYNASTGAYTGVFRPWEFGEFSVAVAVSGREISGSPFTTVMRPF
jgi:hypothetical protein